MTFFHRLCSRQATIPSRQECEYVFTPGIEEFEDMEREEPGIEIPASDESDTGESDVDESDDEENYRAIEMGDSELRTQEGWNDFLEDHSSFQEKFSNAVDDLKREFPRLDRDGLAEMLKNQILEERNPGMEGIVDNLMRRLRITSVR